MNANQIQRILGSILISIASLSIVSNSSEAQPSLVQCQPPQPDEYILLVLSQTWDNHQTLQRSLSQQLQANLCQYLDDTVTRVAGFKNLENAKNWARYIRELSGLSAFVVRSPSPEEMPSNNSAYNPQPLGKGYAVLVDYFNQPELASQIRQILRENVGLVAYGQRHYLLAMHTTSQKAANSTLRQLSDRGFWTMVVDSRRVILLTRAVNF
ncbi:MAG: hypothetical protein F6K36_02705 [Symploca sp. SIO3C6]|uniref:SPOR domain-containing protein n=1 Tax=Symploca sp. SIO1C4 TaxID=2607765 RepID=A0A6B3NJ78_9CYAN|nr:hypothetical protein [Symploca sp. SIO3C6]NER31803.1 hypothetical protein [Symploca sp. SIO1C4]